MTLSQHKRLDMLYLHVLETIPAASVPEKTSRNHGICRGQHVFFSCIYSVLASYSFDIQPLQRQTWTHSLSRKCDVRWDIKMIFLGVVVELTVFTVLASVIDCLRCRTFETQSEIFNFVISSLHA